MHNLLLFKVDEQTISVDALRRIFQSVNGFHNMRVDTPIGTPIKADYDDGRSSTVIHLNNKRDAISIRGTADTAVQAAFVLQSNFDTPLRMVDTDYSFDLMLSDFKSIEDLRAAINDAYAH
jgi:hypothetical protein